MPVLLQSRETMAFPRDVQCSGAQVFTVAFMRIERSPVPGFPMYKS